MTEKHWKYLIWIVLAMITVGAAALDYFRPVFGDDLSFWAFLGLDDYVVPNRRTVSFILAHIFGCNGRLFDYMGPIIVDLMPRWMQSGFMGCMTGLYFFSMWLSIRRLKRGFSIVFLAITLAVMPWWDSMLMHVCQFNYLWGTTFCLLFFHFFFRGKERYGKWVVAGIVLLSVFAGAAHEQTGVAMCTGMFCYGIWHLRYKHFSRMRIWMLAALAFGTLLTLVAPSIWERAGQEYFHWPVWKMVVSTLPVYFVLIATMLLLNTRLKLTAEDIAMFIAATAAALIALVCGIPGRTGWFSESMSLILLARIFLSQRWGIKRGRLNYILAAISIAFILAHYAVSVKYQARAYADHEEMRRQFVESADGVVYLDYLHRYDPPLITLNRVRGVYAPYDAWSAAVLSRTYADGIRQPLVLPSAFKGKEVMDSLTIGDVTLYKPSAPNVFVTQDSTLVQPWHRMIRIVRQAPGFEAAISADLEPGDMLSPIVGKRDKRDQ